MLLLEDDVLDERLLRDRLESAERHQHNFVSARTLNDALNLLQRQSFDVVLADLNLPDSSGLETVEALVSHTDLPVVVLTGFGDLETGVEAIRRGAQDYVPKAALARTRLAHVLRYAIERNDTRREFADFRDHLSTGLRVVDAELAAAASEGTGPEVTEHLNAARERIAALQAWISGARISEPTRQVARRDLAC